MEKNGANVAEKPVYCSSGPPEPTRVSVNAQGAFIQQSTLIADNANAGPIPASISHYWPSVGPVLVVMSDEKQISFTDKSILT